MQDIRERERELEIVDQSQTQRYFSRFEPLLYVPAFTQKDFHYIHTGPPIQGTSTEELQLNTWSTQLHSPIQPPLHKRQGTKSKQRKSLQLGDPMITNSLLVISKDHKQFSHKNKILKLGIE